MEEEAGLWVYVKRQNSTIGGEKVSFRGYDPERTICDLIRNRNRMQAGILTDALHLYVKRKDKNPPRLQEYARIFRVEKIVRRYVDYM
jgi:hypothetical protein